MLHEMAAEAVPVAWAVNGFASVVSACGAVLLAMTIGFRSLFVLAAVLYMSAGLLSLLIIRWIKTRPVDRDSGRNLARIPPRLHERLRSSQ